MFLQIGIGDRKKVVSVNEIFDDIGEDMAKALPALHCFTGSDYTSAFHGSGKVKALKILKNHPEFVHPFALIGRRFTLDVTLFPMIESFTCHLYGLGQCTNTDAARYKKFCSTKNVQSLKSFPLQEIHCYAIWREPITQQQLSNVLLNSSRIFQAPMDMVG